MIRKEDRGSTMMSALLEVEYIFLMSDMYPQYERVCRHNLSDGRSWQILGVYDKKQKKFNPHPPRYNVFKLFGNINECKNRIECKVENSPEIQGFMFYENKSMPLIDARTFQKNNILYIYVVNRGPSEEKININSEKKLIFPGKIEYIGGYLDASNGIDEFNMSRQENTLQKYTQKHLIEIILLFYHFH